MMNSLSLNILSPCKDCTDRVLHCHSSCDKYREYKAKLDQLRSERSAIMSEIEFAVALKSEVRKRYDKRRSKDKGRG